MNLANLIGALTIIAGILGVALGLICNSIDSIIAGGAIAALGVAICDDNY